MNYKQFGIITLAIFASPLLITLLSVPITSVSNVIMLNGMGVDGSAKLFSILGHDYINFGPLLFVIALVASILAIINAKLISYFVTVSPYLLYGVAISVGLAVALVGTVELTFKTQIIAGNRHALGFILHLVAGFFGGVLYAYICSLAPKMITTK